MKLDMDESPHNEVRTRLRQASSRQLVAIVDEHAAALTIGDVRRILRHPYATSEVIETLLSLRKLLANYEVRSAIARHRRTPETVALRFISGLFWRDLLEISVDVRLSPAVRRVAERYLVERLKRLAVGERVAIARRATGEVLARLSRDPSLQVIKALLQNSRLTEQILLPMVSSEETLPRVLDLVAREPRWGTRYEIRLALSCNTRSPFRLIFDILPKLRRADLVMVAEQETHSWVVRHRAEELLADSGI